MDVLLEDHGSIVLLRPVSSNAAVVEPRYVGDIVESMRGDGLVVRL